jgi:hypothetical protein
MEDRLDEKTARRIAIGRLEAARSHAEAVVRAAVDEHPSKNSKVRVQQVLLAFERAYGRLLLWRSVEGRTVMLLLAQPVEGGAVSVDMVTRNVRSDASRWNALLYISPHAAARLMERRRSAKVEELLAEEFGEDTILNLMRCVEEARNAAELQLQTVKGHFIVKKDDKQLAYLAALTWIPHPKG